MKNQNNSYVLPICLLACAAILIFAAIATMPENNYKPVIMPAIVASPVILSPIIRKGEAVNYMPAPHYSGEKSTVIA